MKTLFLPLSAALLLSAAAPLTAQTVPAFQARSKAVSVTGAQAVGREIPARVTDGAINLRGPLGLEIAKRAALVKSIADKIEVRLKAKCVGYAFQVAYQNSATVVARAGGVARRAPDANPRALQINDKVNVASVSKTITAVTLVKLLAEKNISLDASIAPRLPKSIQQHPSISTITFRQLLTHRSGIRWGGEPDHDVLLKGLSQGINPADKKQVYNNSNYGLLRILIPTIEDGYAPPAGADNYAKSYLYGVRTMQATRKRVFEPLGITDVYCASGSTSNTLLCYQFPGPVQAGQDWGDMTATNAYRGWNLSAPQLSKVISALVYTEKLLPLGLRTQLLSGQLGIWHTTVSGLDEFHHGGYHPGTMNLGEVSTVIVAYSNGISVALLVNSQYGPGLSTLDAIRPALDETLKNL